MAKYSLGQSVFFTYEHAPVPPELQYAIGTLVVILDEETKEEIATASVIYSDTDKVAGTIVSVRQE